MQDEPRPENRSSIKLRTSPGGRMEVEKGSRERNKKKKDLYTFNLWLSS